MTDIFLKILNTSVTASYLVVAVIVFRLLFKKAPKWIMCILWGIVALRLIFPFSIESSISLLPQREILTVSESSDVIIEFKSNTVNVDNDTTVTNTTPATENFDTQSNESAMLEDSTQSRTDTTNVAPTVDNNIPNGSVVQHRASKEISLFWLLSVTWICGMLLMLTYSVISYIRLSLKVKATILYRDNVYYCDSIDTPFIFGVFSPNIYIPSNMSTEHLEYVISHESAHIKRCDYIWKPMGILLLTFHWFNPIIWAAYILLCRDIESACDEKVIRDMDDEYKKSYSMALLDCSVHHKAVVTCPVAFGEVGVKDRIKAVLNYRRPAKNFVTISVVVSIIISFCFITTPKERVSAMGGNEDINIDAETGSKINYSELYENFFNRIIGNIDNNEIYSKDKNNVSQFTSPEDVVLTRDSATFKNGNKEYTAKVYFDTEDETNAQYFIVTNTKTGELINNLSIDHYENFTENAIYAIDITFDGNYDLIMPYHMDGTGDQSFSVYVWDVDEKQFVKKSFWYMSNFSLDYKNKCILSHRKCATVFDYYIHRYDDMGKDFYLLSSLCCVVDEMTGVVKVEERHGTNTTKEFTTYCGDYLSLDSNDSNAAEYFKEGSYWDLNSDKWNRCIQKNYYSNFTDTIQNQAYISGYMGFLNGFITADNPENKKHISRSYYLNRFYIGEMMSNKTNPYDVRFAYYDINDDGIPEMIMQSDTYDVFTYKDAKLCWSYETNSIDTIIEKLNWISPKTLLCDRSDGISGSIYGSYFDSYYNNK
ncbi:MAG: M56 family metallopeptidase [Ruminococcaceae bacterium]|nr:M56 family metallopeptidase [Oscillospiraceae bacterium]